MEENRKKLRPYHGIILIILSAIVIFAISPVIGMELGLAGTLLSEILLLVMSIALVVIVKGDLKEVFPVKKPKIPILFGTLILWIASYLAATVLTSVMMLFFPEQIMGISQGLGEAFMSVSFLLSVIIVSMSPAVCEEAVFRGVVLNSFRSSMNKWPVILITGVIFGAFHGNIWRAIPTTLLGIMMGYIFIETGNMVYNAFFHLINNLIPLIFLFAMQKGMNRIPNFMREQSAQIAQDTPLYAGTVGICLIYGSAIPFLLYVGNYLIHRGQPGYEYALFSKRDKNKALVLGIVSVLILAMGFLITVGSLMFEMKNVLI